MFRYCVQRCEVLNLACKGIGRAKFFRGYDRSLFEKHVKYSCVASVTCVSRWIPKLKGSWEICGSVFIKFAWISTIKLEMSPLKKSSCSPYKEIRSKRKHKSKHKSKHEKLKDKHKHKHSKHKSKHKHKKHKEERDEWPVSSLRVRTLGELVIATCSKLAGISTDMECCELATTDKSTSSIVISPMDTSDILHDSEKSISSSRIESNGKSVPKIDSDNSNHTKDLCLEGENLMCTAISGVHRFVEPQLVDLVGSQQDVVLKKSSADTLISLKNNLELAELDETEEGFKKAVGIGTVPLQWQDLSTLTANRPADNAGTWETIKRFLPNLVDKQYYASQGGQCVESGRYWIYSETMMEDTSKWKKFKLISYNVLSQSLLEEHPYLYRQNDGRALEWSFRSQLLFAEIKALDADILCLQEVEHDHLYIFEKQLQSLGYRGIYKKRSHRRVDGVAIFYKPEIFTLEEYTSVEFFQPNVSVLNRDNVALVAKLIHKDLPGEGIVVATTHLLFNMNRHDVKLAQTQLLLAEVERFAYAGTGKLGPKYRPVIITGDMNFKPFSGVYSLLTKGQLRYEGLLKKNLTQPNEGFSAVLNNTLLPRTLHITDSCQHLGILPLRDKGLPDRSVEVDYMKIHNSDFYHLRNSRRYTDSAASSQKFTGVVKSKLLGTMLSQPGSSQSSYENPEIEKIEAEEDSLPSDRFGTGELTHPFNLQSAYTDHDSEVTTHHKSWVTVDYIFYSLPKDEMENVLTLLATYKLPTFDEAVRWGPIPNFNSPSDHYPLLVMFGLDSEPRKTQR